MESSHRLPRNDVVWRRTVTGSSSATAGLPVSSRAGRTLAARPKSTIHTSPGLTAGLFVLHPVEHQGAIEGRLIARGHVVILLGQFQQQLPDRPAVGLGQSRQLLQDFSGAHAGKIANRPPSAKSLFLVVLVQRKAAGKSGSERAAGRLRQCLKTAPTSSVRPLSSDLCVPYF